MDAMTNAPCFKTGTLMFHTAGRHCCQNFSGRGCRRTLTTSERTVRAGLVASDVPYRTYSVDRQTLRTVTSIYPMVSYRYPTRPGRENSGLPLSSFPFRVALG